MSSGQKRPKKRKRRSPAPAPPAKSQIARRLEKIRTGRSNLWDDDDDDDDDDNDDFDEQPRKKPSRISHVTFSDSGDEGPLTSSHRQRKRNSKPRKKSSRRHNEAATCLICSILSQLSSHNCCSAHLSALKSLSKHPQHASHSRRLSEQVMIIPMSEEIVQRYLDPQSTRSRPSASSINRSTSESRPSTRKPLNKSTTTPKRSDAPRPAKNTPKSVTKSSQADIRPLASTIVIGTARSRVASVPPDVTSSSSPTPTNRATTMTDDDPFEPSPTNTSIVDDAEQPSPGAKVNYERETKDPWTAISDETDAALEQVLNQVELSVEPPLEFTPATARRTDTEVMAARLPKIPLKEGRFRNGKPIAKTAASNAGNEHRPLPTTSIAPADHRDIFTQDEVTRQESIPIPTETNETLATRNNENAGIEIETSPSNAAQQETATSGKERFTPSRISVRMNPDGSQVRISRPALTNNRQSPSIGSLRRTSTDVTPVDPNAKQL